MSEYLRRDQRKPPLLVTKITEIILQSRKKTEKEKKHPILRAMGEHEPCGVHGGSPMAGGRRPEPELEPGTETAGLGGSGRGRWPLVCEVGEGEGGG
jgi:hypothetical protein